MFKFAQQLVFGAPSEPEQSTASPTLNNKLGEVRQSRVSWGQRDVILLTISIQSWWIWKKVKLTTLIQKITMEGGRPWGFKIAGGAEVNKPIIITKVNIFQRVTLPKSSFSIRPRLDL